jgi:transposase
MSTSLLYHAFGIRGYEYLQTCYKRGQVFFKIHQKRENLRCSICKSRDVIRKGTIQRQFRSLPIGRRTVWIILTIQRVFCRSCDKIRQVNLGFADPRFTYTKSFERYALDLCRHMTILDVARHLDVSWDTIKNIQKRYLKKHFSRPKLKKLKRIAIDEITIGHGHQYLTIVLDLVTGAVVFVGDGKGSEALDPFWKRLKRSKATIGAVAIDMSPSYISAVTENLPKAVIVFDHFHVIKLYNERLSEFRRHLYYQVKTSMEKEVIKGTRWLLLKNPENLNPEHDEQQRLQKALELNQPLATVYYMKEDLRRLWSQKNQKAASSFLDDWVSRAKSSGIKMLEKFADTLMNHRYGILSYYLHSISTGPLEGTNNKIKTMKRQAYGFRDMEFFKLKIMSIHMTRYALVG